VVTTVRLLDLPLVLTQLGVECLMITALLVLVTDAVEDTLCSLAVVDHPLILMAVAVGVDMAAVGWS
jgi:hypothetical protein